MTSATNHFLEMSDGVTVHVKQWTPHETPQHIIICLHGLTRNAKDFDGVAPWLMKTYKARIIVPTCRGRGQSDRDANHLNYNIPQYVDDILAILDYFNIPQAIFLGTSMGGIISMILAAQVAEKVKALILNDIGPDIAPEGVARIVGYLGAGGTPFTDWKTATAKIEQLHKSTFPHADKAFWQDFTRKTYVETDQGIIADYDPMIAAALAEGDPAPDLWPAFTSLSCPILSLRGGLSDLLTPEIVTKMLAIQPQMHDHDIKDVGHAPTLEEPDAKQAIDQFIKAL